MGQNISSDSSDGPIRPNLDYTNVNSWTVDDVCFWVLKELTNTSRVPTTSFDVQRIRSNQIDGKAMLQLDDEGLMKLGIHNPNHRVLILKAISSLDDMDVSRSDMRKMLKIEKDSLLAMQKMEDALVRVCPGYVRNKCGTDVNIAGKQLAMSLVVEEDMISSFLNKEESATQSVLDLLSQIVSDDSTSVERLKKVERIIEDAAYSYWKGLGDYTGDIKIKLLFVEDSPSTIEKLCPIIYKMNNAEAEKCMPLKFIAAVTVGPWYLEWNETNLVVPRKCCANSIVYAEEIGKPLGTLEIDCALSRTAQFITNWNASKTFNAETCNSTHFAQELCESLELKWPTYTAGQFSDFLERIHSTGVSEMSLAPVNNLQATSPKPNIIFKSHREFDEYLWEYMQSFDSDDVSNHQMMLEHLFNTND